MGLKLENVLTGFVIFSILTGLIFGIYTAFSLEYGITPDYVNSEGKSVIEALYDINVISGFDQVQNAITALYASGDSTGSEFDILGSLRASAIGVVKISTGILTAPLEIIGIITGFYTLPPAVSIGIGLIIIIYLGYMVLSEFLGK